MAEAPFEIFRGDSSGGRVLLETSIVAAAAGITVGVNRHVAELASHSVRAVQNFSIGNHSTTNAGTDGDRHRDPASG